MNEGDGGGDRGGVRVDAVESGAILQGHGRSRSGVAIALGLAARENDGGTTIMISPQKAIQAAAELITEVYGDEGARSIRVEELDLIAKDGAWHVTLSFFPPTDMPDLSEAMRSIIAPERIYKTFDVDAESGFVRSMKIRELQ